MMTWMKSICMLFILSVCMLTCEIAAGRAGGGGGFSSGGGGFSGGGGGYSGGGYSGGGYSSGGHSTSDGEGEALVFAVIFIFVVVCFLFRAWTEGLGDRVGTDDAVVSISRRHRSSPANQAAAESTIQNADPQFDAKRFLGRFSDAFLQIQKAWQAQNMEPVRHFVSDGILERFTLQLQEQRDMGYRDHMEQIQVHSSRLAEATTSEVFEVLTVQVDASAIDYRVSIKSGAYLSGSRSREAFMEYWSFVRRRGAETDTEKRGLIEGHCPNCGDSIRINQAEKCPSCQALLRSGEYDWVLSEITQGCVWRPQNPQEDALARRYRERRDPGFNVQHLEDRASVIFWRKAMADRVGDTKPLLKVATSEICHKYAAEYKKGTGGKERRYFGGCSVGSVQLRGVVEEDNYDYSLVMIHWSANEFGVTSGGAVRDRGGWRRYKSLYVLRRRRGVHTNIQRSIDSAYCPNCGAPESDLASHACEFCEMVLNDGRYDWVLFECHAMRSGAAHVWLEKAKKASRSYPTSGSNDVPGEPEEPVPSYSDLLAWATSVFAADKVIDDRERQVLHQLAIKQQMPEPMLAGFIDGALAGELDAPSPTPATRKAWMEQMVDVALLDGQVQPDEQAVLVQLGQRAGLTGADVKLLINKRRAKRLREARENGGSPQPIRDPPKVHRVLLEALCCVMVSDGKASRAERDAIVEILKKARAPLTPAEIDELIADFVSRVKDVGLREVLDRCAVDVGLCCTKRGNRKAFQRAFQVVADADDTFHGKERYVINRLMAASNTRAHVA
jgi:uncharacterized tellurite resistance protein B-like protein